MCWHRSLDAYWRQSIVGPMCGYLVAQQDELCLFTFGFLFWSSDVWLTWLGSNVPMEVSSAFCFEFFNLFWIKNWSLRTPQKLGSFWEIQCSMNIDTVLLWSDLGCHILHSFDRTKYIDTWDEILFYGNPSLLWTVPLVFVSECVGMFCLGNDLAGHSGQYPKGNRIMDESGKSWHRVLTFPNPGWNDQEERR